MNSHDQAVQELIEEGFLPDIAELMALSEEELNLVFDLETGETVEIDPDAPIPYEPTPAGEAAAGGAA